jgi:hypothetical protein
MTLYVLSQSARAGLPFFPGGKQNLHTTIRLSCPGLKGKAQQIPGNFKGGLMSVSYCAGERRTEPACGPARCFERKRPEKASMAGNLRYFRQLGLPHEGPKASRPEREERRLFSAEALQKFKHILPIVSRILSSAKDFYFWQSPHNACTVNADRER